MSKTGEILSNVNLKSDYYSIVFYAPEIAASAQAGQFVHVKIGDDRGDWILRRPFSICDTDPAAGTVNVVYKVVGKGTAELSRIQPG